MYLILSVFTINACISPHKVFDISIFPSQEGIGRTLLPCLYCPHPTTDMHICTVCHHVLDCCGGSNFWNLISLFPGIMYSEFAFTLPGCWDCRGQFGFFVEIAALPVQERICLIFEPFLSKEDTLICSPQSELSKGILVIHFSFKDV